MKTTGRSAASVSSNARTAQKRLLRRRSSLPGIPIACPTRSAIARGVFTVAGQRSRASRRASSGVSVSLQVRDLDQRLGQRIERDPLAVGQAATAQDRRASADLVRRTPRGAGTCRHPPTPSTREELARLVGRPSGRRRRCRRESSRSRPTIGASRCRANPARPGVTSINPVRRNRLGLALHGQVRDRLGEHRVADERVGPFAEEDLAGRGGLFQACRHVDGVAASRSSGRPARRRPPRRCSRPIRQASVIPRSRSSSGFNASSAARISLAARTARSASSSWTCGTPKTAITASPMNFSTAPPWRSIAARIASKNRSMTRRTDSGSSSSPIAVEPATSQNTTVTVLRTSCEVRRATSGAAQFSQNFAPPRFSCPHLSHRTTRAA